MNPFNVQNAPHEEKSLQAYRRFLSVWTLVGACVLAGVVVYLLGVLSLPVAIVLWTVVIVFCLAGVVDWFEEKGLSRTLGTAVAYVIMVAILAIVAVLLFSPVIGFNTQLRELADAMPTYISNFKTWADQMYNQYSYLFENDTVRQWINDAANSAMSSISNIFSGSANGIATAATSIANGVMAIGFAFVIAFWMLMELPAMGREFRRLIGPEREEDFELLSLTSTRVVGGYIKATLLQCLIIGIGCGILFAVTGIPSAAALGGIAGILNIIPVVGPWLGGLVAAVVGLFVSPMIALVALIGTICIQQFVYTFVSPKIMQNSVDIHPALTLIVLTIGSAIGGAMSGMAGSILGMLLSIPAVAIIKSLFVYYFEKHTGRQLVADDGVFFQGSPAEDEAVNPLADALSPADYEKGLVMEAQAAIDRTEKMRAVREEFQRTGRINIPRPDRPPLDLPSMEDERELQVKSEAKHSK